MAKCKALTGSAMKGLTAEGTRQRADLQQGQQSPKITYSHEIH